MTRRQTASAARDASDDRRLAPRPVRGVDNTGVRNDEALDSLQTLLLRVAEGTVVEVKVAVDDECAVESFWSG